MLKNYLKVILRNISRHKGYSFLNVFGLAIGVAVTALIMLYVQYEWQYDSFFPNTERIYRVIQRQPGNMFMGTDYFAVTQEQLGMTLKSEFPEVESYTTIENWKDIVISPDNKQLFDENVLFATAPDFFNMFSYEFVEGNPQTALSELNSVVLSDKMAGKLFGSGEVLGRTITASGKYLWKVTGIFKSLPGNSQFSDFDVISSFKTYVTTTNKKYFTWGNSSWYTYLLLKKGTDPDGLQAKLPSIVIKYIDKPQNVKGTPKQFILQPLKKIHLFNKANFDLGISGDVKTVMILIALGLIILLIACINYTNLSTARASLRAREVGIRKVVGANKRQLISQFIGESIMLAAFAGILALVIDELFLPNFIELTGLSAGSISLLQSSFLSGFAILVLIVGLLSGSYPAFILSMYEPARVLKGEKVRGERTSLRQILVVIQFAASIALIISTLVILSQMNFIRTKNMGYNRDNVIVLQLTDPSVNKNLDVFKLQLSQFTAVKNITACSHLPINITSETDVKLPGQNDDEGVQAYQLYTDYDFLKTFNIPLVEGRDFSPAMASDSTSAILINQTLEEALGFKHAVGKTLNINGIDCSIIGVMNDFNMHSVRHKIQPLFVALFNPWKQYLCIRISGQNIPGTIADIKSIWDHFATQRTFKYTFLDADFNKLYSSEHQLSEIVNYSSGLAIFIACLGLLGLVSFVVEQRKKEIGIRKVLGASIADVLRLLSVQFLKLVILANIFAWPVAYYLMHIWLNGFVYKINQDIWPFVLAGLSVLFISLAAVSSLAMKAAHTNPADTLKYE
jgi:putative ABC transport system permease protein